MAQTEQRGKSDRKHWQQRPSRYGFDHRLLSPEERCGYARLPRSTLSLAYGACAFPGLLGECSEEEGDLHAQAMAKSVIAE
jgi:hypothetical protein